MPASEVESRLCFHGGTAFEAMKEGVMERPLVFITATETKLQQVVIIYIP